MKSQRKGITLVELTATVVAIAVLAAVLTPALADVRRRGKDTVCLQNLARIAQASTIYAARDPDGQAVPIHPVMGYGPVFGISSGTILGRMTTGYGGKSGRGKRNGAIKDWSTAFGIGPGTRPMNAVIYKGGIPDYSVHPYGNYPPYSDVLTRWKDDENLDLAVYRCPADTGYPGYGSSSLRDSGLSAFDHYGNSYYANSMWIGGGPGSQLSSNSILLHPLSDIVSPGTTLWYLEHAAVAATWVAPTPASCPYDFPAATIRGWHGKNFRFNVAFADAHADAVRIRGFSNPRLGHYPDLCGFGPPSYDCVRCIIARGPGWQKDTLPLPPVETNLIWSRVGKTGDADDCTTCLRLMPPEPGTFE